MSLVLSLNRVGIARDTTSFPPGWNGLARTPPMGWRSWNAFGNRISQDMMMVAADAVVSKNRTVAGYTGKVSLCDLGYCSVGVDEGWEGCGAGVNGTQHAADGTPTIDAAFPDTAKMVKNIHDLSPPGQKLSAGWYLNGCKCGEHVEKEINYAGDIRSLHKFDFDGVKIDGCGDQKNQTLYAALMRDSKKNYTIENCHWGDCTDGDDSSCPTKDWCPWNWYRTSEDINGGPMSWLKNLQTTTRFQDYKEPLSVPGCWAYPDMLEVGRVVAPLPSATMSWNRAHFGAWCIVSAPLILGLELTDEKLNPILDIIGNKAAVKVNQEWAGHPGMLVMNLIAPPQQATTGGKLLTVPTRSAGDFFTSNGAGISGGHGDAATSGASNIRTGGPGETSVIEMGTGIVGVAGAMELDSLSMSFRYTAGYYTTDPSKKASVVSVEILDMKTKAVLKTLWTSQPLGNYSWDHFTTESPPIKVEVKSGIALPLAASGAPVVIAMRCRNNDRNLQIPIDDLAKGFDLQLGFTKGTNERSDIIVPSQNGFVGIYPFDGSVPFGSAQVWAKPQLNGAMAVLMINHGGKTIDSFSVPFRKALNLTALKYDVMDVWTQKPRSAAAGGATTMGGNLTFAALPAYDSGFVVLTPKK